jgi:hypothetical protein
VSANKLNLLKFMVLHTVLIFRPNTTSITTSFLTQNQIIDLVSGHRTELELSSSVTLTKEGAYCIMLNVFILMFFGGGVGGFSAMH